MYVFYPQKILSYLKFVGVNQRTMVPPSQALPYIEGTSMKMAKRVDGLKKRH